MYRALVTFSGKVSMAVGDVMDISDKSIVNDLLNAGYIEEVNPPKKDEPKEEKPKPKKKRGGSKK